MNSTSKSMRKKTVVISVIIAATAVLVAFGGYFIWRFMPSDDTKFIEVTVYTPNGAEQSIETQTTYSYMADVLKEMNVLDNKSDEGIYDTVYYIQAVNGGKWAFYLNGHEKKNIEKAVIKDDDKITIRYIGAANDD